MIKAKAAALAGLTLEATARYLRISRQTLRDHPELLAVMEDAEAETTIDAAQRGLEIMHDRKQLGPAGAMARYWLTHRGGSKWSDKVILGGAPGEPLKVEAPGFKLTPDKIAEALAAYARAHKKSS